MTAKAPIHFVVALVLLFCAPLRGSDLEIFAKGTVSKNYLNRNSWNISVSVASGIAVAIFPRLRIEGRYTNISSLQNSLDVGSPVTVGTINDMKTETAIYSVGIDWDILGDKVWFQPFLYIGAGYVITSRSYYFTPSGGGAVYISEPKEMGFSENLGAGFRIRLARSVAFEVEAYAYGRDLHKSNPLVNLQGLVGIRLFL